MPVTSTWQRRPRRRNCYWKQLLFKGVRILVPTHHAYKNNVWAQVEHRPEISGDELNIARPHKYCTVPTLWGVYPGPSVLETSAPSRRNTSTACRVNARRLTMRMRTSMQAVSLSPPCFMNSNTLHECSVFLVSVLCVLTTPSPSPPPHV